MAKVNQSRAGSEALLKAMQVIARKQTRIGFFEQAKFPDGTSVAYMATLQEFHPQNARPFMRLTIEQQREAWRESLRCGCKAVVNGHIDAVAMLHQFGMKAAEDVKKTISQIVAPELTEATTGGLRSRRKIRGVSVKPLVDMGLLIGSVSSDVVDL
jgi:hypothetical protein